MVGKLLAVIVGVAVAIAMPRAADACGAWYMQDAQKKLDVRWDISSGAIKSAKTKKRAGALYLDIESKDGIKVVTSKRVVYDIKDGKLRKYGKPVGTVDEGTITIGKKTWSIAFSDQKPLHDMPSWTVTVKQGETVVIESKDASALCAAMQRARTGVPMSDAEQQDEIRRRVAYYLAWRELKM